MSTSIETESGPDASAQSGASDAVVQCSGADMLQAIDALYNLEMRTNIAALRHQQRHLRRHRSLTEWSTYWPVALGILVSFFTPQLREFVEAYRPWGLWVSFPMVALSIRPEMYMGSKMAVLLPTAMMYLQFPMEGLLARIALRGNVTVYGVALQVLFFHGLCLVDLWLLNGGVLQLLHQLGH